MNHKEISFRSILLSIFLTLILAMSNAYLALKLGILTSASIPAAIVSMGILRLFKNSSIVENNAVQTAASAGEAVAGGIVYTIPALVIIGYWHHFDYWTNCFIALSGGVLGVLFSIPLRRILVNDRTLRFPEGVAIAQVLKSSQRASTLHDLIWGSVVGAALGLLQSGFKVLASTATYWVSTGRVIVGLGFGFSPAMLGAGFIVGFDMAFCIFLGAMISWVFALPLVSYFSPEYWAHHTKDVVAELLWSDKMRYIGIGAMLFAGILTFVRLLKPLVKSMYHSWQQFSSHRSDTRLDTDKDLAWAWIGIGVLSVALSMWIFFKQIFPLSSMGLASETTLIVSGAVAYVLIVGFLFSVMTAYFSGMVGVTASPGSSVVIAGILAVSWLLYQVMRSVLPAPLTYDTLAMAQAIVIVISSVVTGIAAIANDNTQDLKVGQLVGATPWKQQLMLLLGVMVASFIIPWVMQVLFDVYGIAGVMPHEGMNPEQSLPAPVAALLAAITKGVFHSQLPWNMMLIGTLVIAGVLLCNRILRHLTVTPLSILGVAMGMYLPMSTSLALFLGGVMALWMKKIAARHGSQSRQQQFVQTGTLLACGLVTGSALMDVVLAIPFSMMKSPDALSIVGAQWQSRYGLLLSVLSVCLLGYWIKQRAESVFKCA